MASGKDQVCRRCRASRLFGKYDYTLERDAMLREAYGSAKTRRELTSRLTAFMELTKIPHGSMHRRCKELGLRFCAHQAWTATEDAYLAENVREMPVRQLAKTLGRSSDSVRQRLTRMGESYRVSRDGYTRRDAAWLLGVSAVTLQRWMVRGWLRIYGDTFSPNAMRKFLREHLEELNLARADQQWIKGELADMLRGRNEENDESIAA